MKLRCIVVLLLMFFFYSCINSSRPSKVEAENPVVRDTVIRLVGALDQIQKICLSEIADSVTYIPLETNADCLMNNYWRFHYTAKSIITLNRLFDWDGKFIRRIGEVGSGKGEDPNQYLSLLESEENYYTIGNKIIEYDKTGKYTGKETQKYQLKSDKDSFVVYNLYREYQSTLADGHVVIYQYADSLYWINKEMKVTHVERVIEPGKLDMGGVFTNPTDCFFPKYKESTLFYNFFNDTIFTVTKDGLRPEWVVDLGDQKLPNEVSLFKAFTLERKAIYKGVTPGAVENSELVQKSDNKLQVYFVHEVERYLFLGYARVRRFAELRKKERTRLCLAIYDKYSKKITNIGPGGIIDDLDNGPGFSPMYGAFGEKLISAKWAYELKNYVKENRNIKKISPKLLELADQLKEDDNPVLIIVHLKSNI